MNEPTSNSNIQNLFTTETIQAWLVSNIAQQLEIEPNQIDVRQPLENYNLNSVQAMLLIDKASTLLGLEISPSLLWHYPTVESLALRLAEELSEMEVAIGQVEDLNQDTRRQGISSPPPKPIDLKAEAVLDSDIYPHTLASKPIAEPRYVFLTGGTGFLGAFLIHEILHQTQANIYCLVRGSNLEEGNKRLQKNLERYSLSNGELSTRIIPVIGDLSKPMLGIELEYFQELSNKIDTIYHSAASVNYIYPYEAMKANNILGTQEILRFACQGKIKPVHYISSLAVFESSAYSGKVVTEADKLEETTGIYLGYSQSKWVAEKLVRLSQERGLPVTIYRPSFISGDSRTGSINTSDFIYLMLKSCLEMGYFPDWNYQLDASPVDYVSQAIVYLSKEEGSWGKAFHLQDPQPLNLVDFFDLICSLGYPIVKISYQEWLGKVKQLCFRSPDHPLYPLQPLLFEKISEDKMTLPELYVQTRRPKILCQETIDALANSSIVCPRQDSKLVSVLLSYLTNSGFLNKHRSDL